MSEYLKKATLIIIVFIMMCIPVMAQDDVSDLAKDGLFSQLFKLLMPFGLTFDDDETLEFFWSVTSGNIDHYTVVLWVNGIEHPERWDTTFLPTKELPYAVPYIAKVGDVHRIQVAGVNTEGEVGQMSDLSSPVLRIPNTSVSNKPEAITD